MLTNDEAELYDRQIRLWGVNAQSRIRQSKVLMLGFEGIASEVAKILVLAGIDTLTIVDDKELQKSDLASNLFCRNPSDQEKFRTHDTINKLKKLNPLVKVNICNSPITSLETKDYDSYDLVTLHSFLTIDGIANINTICREKRSKFYLVLDYGFFGFMFNDLGAEFKFSHQVFDKIESDSQNRQTGEEKDPISIADDPKDDEDDDDDKHEQNLDVSDDENTRPKKKMRIYSPKRGSTNKTDEVTTKLSTLAYVPFTDMITTKYLNCTRMTSPVLFTSIAMLKFFSQYNHLPRCEDSQSRSEDVERLNNILESTLDELNVDKVIMRNLDKNWVEHIYGSLSPVCAVLGGAAGQDMIRALSSKDIPLNNTFSFDGITMMGIVEKVGFSTPKESQAKAVVRDYIEIE